MTEPMAPPPPPFPMAPAPKSSNTMKWVLGCGCGCLVMIVVAVIALGAGGYFFAKSAAPKAIQAGYQQMKTEGKVPAEHLATYDRIVELGTGGNPSLSATALLGGVVFGTLADGAVSEEELSAVNDALAMLEANPSITATQLQEFQTKHPQYMGAQPGAFGMPMPPAALEPEPPKEPEAAVPPAAETPAEVPTEGVAPAGQ